MWSLNTSDLNPNFGFHVEIVQKLENGNKVYGGYGFRVVEIVTEEGNTVYQLRVKDNLLLDWGLLGTFRSTDEVKRRVAQLDHITEQKSVLSF